MKRLFACIFSALMMMSCLSRMENESMLESESIVVNAACADTKSMLMSDFSVSWNLDDRITVLSIDGSVSAVSKPGGAESSKCTFRISDWPDGVDPRYAVFGGNSDKPCAEINGRFIRASIPTSQIITDAETFGRESNLAIGEILKAASGGYEVQMKNVPGLLRFSLGTFDNVKSVTIYDKASKAALSGQFDISMEDGVPVVKGTGVTSTSVAVKAEEGAVFQKDKSYYICVRPGVDFTPEFIMSLTDGRFMVYTYPETIRVRRSMYVDCGIVDSDAQLSDERYLVSNEDFVNGENYNDFVVWEDKLVEGYHPRLIFTQKEFDQLKTRVEGTDALGKLHSHLMKVADESLADESKLEFQLDESNKRILDVSRNALARLVSCAYAYRMTGLTKYSDKASQDLMDVCSFSSWNPSHYLDVAEMSAAVSIAYDWLYDVLSESVKTSVVAALKKYALDTSRNSGYTWWYDRIGNWNQVCNGGLVCAAVAIYEYYPALAQAVIDDAVATNRTAVQGIYYPDGAYPEGPTYWGYGTIYQVLMLTILEDVFYTDFNISSAQGFMDTGLFKIFARGSMGMQFNFADNGVSSNSNYPMYYFAYKTGNPSMLYQEMSLLEKESYTGSEHKGLMVLALKYAMKMNLTGLVGPTQKFYSAQGNTPVMMCRSGWESGDHYLGAKGGQDGYLHGHMDGGMFVYYADNVRWALDINRQNYADLENALERLGGKLADYSQNSLRWRLFRLNCRQHNTLTVNDKDHNVKAVVQMTATENTSSRMAATFDMTPLFDGDLVRAERTAALCDESYIEIKDILKAPADRAAHVRWTMVTMAKPEITQDGIILSRNSKSRLLKTEGGSVDYKIWSSELNDYDTTLKIDGQPIEAPISTDSDKYVYICGYETDIPAGQEFTLITTLKKL